MTRVAKGDLVLEGGTCGTWGGAIDEWEDAGEAALRELREECGYDGVATLIPLYVFRSGGFRYTTFLAVVDRQFRPKLNWETAKASWMTLEKLRTLDLHFGVEALLDDPAALRKIHGARVRAKLVAESAAKKARYAGDSVECVYRGQKVGTGLPLVLTYLRNTEKSGYYGDRFGQDIEPAGQYVSPLDSDDHGAYLVEHFPGKYEMGVIEFKNPLVLVSPEDDPTVGWKRKLSQAYGGKKRRVLSKAVIQDGYDGIVTVTKYGLSETVNLQAFR